MEESAVELGYVWFKPLAIGIAVLTSATVLRAAGRVFVGWGADGAELLKESPKIEEPRETVREYH